MKQNFDKCLEMLLKHEGGFINHPRDPGGATNFGVTKKTYETWIGHSVSIDEIKELTVEDVAPIYKARYWDAVRGDELPSGVDWAVFDWAVNSGPSRAAKALQKAAGASQDGKIGPMTLRSIANNDPKDLIDRVYHTRQTFYERLKTFDTFGKGWTRRNKETLEAALEMI